MNRNSKFKVTFNRYLLGGLLVFSITCLVGCGNLAPDTAEEVTHSEKRASENPPNSTPATDQTTVQKTQTKSLCEQIYPKTKLGPPLNVREVEAESIKEMELQGQSNPEGSNAPVVPFGYINAEWASLKSVIKPGNTLHKFTEVGSEGYLVLRGQCIVGQMWTAIA